MRTLTERSKSDASLAAAVTEVLPTVLVDPVWAAQAGYAAATVLTGLAAPAVDTARWQPGEREDWAGLWLNWPTVWQNPHPGWVAACVSHLAAGTLLPDHEAKVLVKGDMEQVRPLLAKWRPKQMDGAALWMKVVIARFEGDAVPVVLRIARKTPAVGGELLQPLTGCEVAALMADWLIRVPSMRPTALTWLARHPRDAASALIPVAVGELGAARAAAEYTLRLLAEQGHHESIVDAAHVHGQAVVDALNALLAVPRFMAPPAWLPKPPKWLDPATLPPVLSRDGQRLPEDPIRVLCGILGQPRIGEMRGRIPAIKQGCDEASLAAFGWALLEQWVAAKSPAKDAWVVTAAGLLGNDEIVARLVAQIIQWGDTGLGARAVKGLDALGAMGSDVALMHVERLSRTAKVKRLKKRAGELLTEIAQERQLSEEQLADRLVPDFGLDASGSLVLDYGPRRFTVGFDEQLKPWIAEENGTRRALLPKPSASDDQALATAAYNRFATLKKDVRAIASDQIRRLERAMISQRHWTSDEFQQLLVGHPLLWHLTRRLVWASFDDSGTLCSAFRVAEDRSLAGVEDDEITLDAGLSVRVAHPVQLGDEVPTWSELFGDYEILQPFPQLGRGVFTFEEGEADRARLARFESVKVPTGKILGFRARGWQLCIGDSGEWDWAERRVSETRIVRINLTPGINPGYVADSPEQQLSAVWISIPAPNTEMPSTATPNAATPDTATPDTVLTPVRFGDLDPLMASEILRDLHDLTT